MNVKLLNKKKSIMTWLALTLGILMITWNAQSHDSNGPRLWKAQKGDQTLWILGTLDIMPKKPQWQSQHIKNIIKQSQAFILPPNIDTDFSFFEKIAMLPALSGITKDPQKRTLKQILNPEDYQKWQGLKQKFLNKNKSVEKSRPIFAAYELLEQAADDQNFSLESKILKNLSKFAKKNDIKIIEPLILMDIEKPRSAIEKFKKAEINDHACLTSIMIRVEDDLDSLKKRALAWAQGDIQLVESLRHPDQRKICDFALLKTDLAREYDVDNILYDLKIKWIETTLTTLTKYRTSFAVLPINHLLENNNYLDELSKHGYIINPPK